mmetsp:Transcript_11496/g.28957  ORF Transcript_11496/g.28957 Transcript_11496/m.28957 type:complete len:194 (-) Transcript_11496:104-685(-)
MVGLTARLHRVVQHYLHAGARAVDFTCGNGHDTAFLAQQVGPTGHVYAFDIQEQAIKSTRQLLQRLDLSQQVQLFCCDHSLLRQKIPTQSHGQIAAFMGNLGYLPHSDRQVITRAPSTVSAIKSAMELLHPNGVITIAVYRGHPGGKEESDAILEFMGTDGARFFSKELINFQTDTTRPYGLVITPNKMAHEA